MRSLSSRAQVGTHSASYVYHDGDFRGIPEALLLKYFDIFFYISHWGTIRLMFKYPVQEIDITELKNTVLNLLSAVSCREIMLC